MKRNEIVEAIAKALQEKPVCRCYTGRTRWEEDAEVAYDTALPLIRDALADAIHKREIAAGLGDVEAPKTWWDAYRDAAGIVKGMDL